MPRLPFSGLYVRLRAGEWLTIGAGKDAIRLGVVHCHGGAAALKIDAPRGVDIERASSAASGGPVQDDLPPAAGAA